MSLERICFLIVIIGLICLVCIPLEGNASKIGRIAVVVAGVIWTILQFASTLPVR